MSYLSVLEKETTKKSKSSADIKFINVFKNRIPGTEIPAYLKRNKFYNFFEIDSLTDFVTEISYQEDPDKDHEYWMKIFDIAADIKNIIESDSSPVKAAEKLVKNLRPSGIYIAQSGIDQYNQRDNLCRELSRSQYDVYELDSIEGSYDDIVKQINEKLSKCQLSIHLVGEDSGALIKDRGLSIVEIENQLASDHSSQVNDKPGVKYYERFNRIIWISEDHENLTVKQKIFIDNLKKDLVNIQYAEIMDCPIETLKGFIVGKINENKRGREQVITPEVEKGKSIYLICDKTEREECKPISNFLKEQGYKVILSNFDGEILQIRDKHLKNLKECDGTLIYHGKNNENWVKSKLFDSVKALGLGRSKDKNPTAVIVDSNKKVDLDLYFNKDNLILLKNQKVNKSSFKSFLNQLD
jgi:ribose 5-phosphate isomerase RpiB